MENQCFCFLLKVLQAVQDATSHLFIFTLEWLSSPINLQSERNDSIGWCCIWNDPTFKSCLTHISSCPHSVLYKHTHFGENYLKVTLCCVVSSHSEQRWAFVSQSSIKNTSVSHTVALTPSFMKTHTHTHTSSFCHKHSVEHQLWINPQLKIVLNRCFISSVGWINLQRAAVWGNDWSFFKH